MPLFCLVSIYLQKPKNYLFKFFSTNIIFLNTIVIQKSHLIQKPFQSNNISRPSIVFFFSSQATLMTPRSFLGKFVDFSQQQSRFDWARTFNLQGTMVKLVESRDSTPVHPVCRAVWRVLFGNKRESSGEARPTGRRVQRQLICYIVRLWWIECVPVVFPCSL